MTSLVLSLLFAQIIPDVATPISSTCNSASDSSRLSSWSSAAADAPAQAPRRKSATPARANARAPGAACSSDAECIGRCQQGVCVNERLQLEPAPPPPECSEDEDCANGTVCRRFKCVTPTLPVPSGHAPAALPAVVQASLEMLLDARGPQLAEELALGRGALLSTLAQVRHLEPDRVGAAARAHHAELASVLRVHGSKQFLARLDALLGIEVAARGP